MARDFSATDLAIEVQLATDAIDGTYDAPAITRAILDQYGITPIDTIEPADFWNIVGQHATS